MYTAQGCFSLSLFLRVFSTLLTGQCNCHTAVARGHLSRHPLHRLATSCRVFRWRCRSFSSSCHSWRSSVADPIRLRFPSARHQPPPRCIPSFTLCSHCSRLTTPWPTVTVTVSAAKLTTSSLCPPFRTSTTSCGLSVRISRCWSCVTSFRCLLMLSWLIYRRRC